MAIEAKEAGTNIQSWVPPQLADQVGAKAETEKRSVSQIVRFALEDQLRKERRP